jgi:hypothetical protein
MRICAGIWKCKSGEYLAGLNLLIGWGGLTAPPDTQVRIRRFIKKYVVLNTEISSFLALSVVGISTADGWDEDQALALATAIESNSKHDHRRHQRPTAARLAACGLSCKSSKRAAKKG